MRSTAPTPRGTRDSSGRRVARPQLGILAAIAAGGALGTPARYAIEDAFPPQPGAFPTTTFVINVSGALALGLLLILLLERFPPTRYLRPLVGTGFLGAFTTFSTFTVEIVTLGRDGHVPMAVTYAAVSLGAGLVAVRTGMTLGRRLPRLPRSRS